MPSVIKPTPHAITALPLTAALHGIDPRQPSRIRAVFNLRGRFGFLLLALAGAGLVAVYCETLRQCNLGDGTVVVALAIFVAALTSGIAGFAFSGICGAMLFHLMHGPVEIVRLMMACSIANQMMGVWAVRRAMHWPSLRPFLLAGLVGVPFGVYLLTHANPALYERVIGVLLVGYCTWKLLRKPVAVRQTTTLGDLLVGSVAGVAGGFAGLAGVPTTIRVAMKGWDKDRQRALFQPLILGNCPGANPSVRDTRSQAVGRAGVAA
jgi:uncharacterized protein